MAEESNTLDLTTEEVNEVVEEVNEEEAGETEEQVAAEEAARVAAAAEAEEAARVAAAAEAEEAARVQKEQAEEATRVAAEEEAARVAAAAAEEAARVAEERAAKKAARRAARVQKEQEEVARVQKEQEEEAAAAAVAAEEAVEQAEQPVEDVQGQGEQPENSSELTDDLKQRIAELDYLRECCSCWVGSGRAGKSNFLTAWQNKNVSVDSNVNYEDTLDQLEKLPELVKLWAEGKVKSNSNHFKNIQSYTLDKSLFNEKSNGEKVEVVEQLVTLLTDCANGKMRVTQIEEVIDNLY